MVPQDSFADTLVNKAAEEASDLLLLPWSETGNLSDKPTVSAEKLSSDTYTAAYTAFVRSVLDSASCNAIVFINQGFSGTLKQRPAGLHRPLSMHSTQSPRDHPTTTLSVDQSHHIFLPFFSLGADDRVALHLAIQLAENPGVTATVVHFDSPDTIESAAQIETVTDDQKSEEKRPELVSAVSTTSRSIQNEFSAFFAATQRSIPAEMARRVVFESRSSTDPLNDALTRARSEVAQNPRNGGDIIVVGRHIDQFKKIGPTGCLGSATDMFASSGIRASLLVVQARGSGLE